MKYKFSNSDVCYVKIVLQDKMQNSRMRALERTMDGIEHTSAHVHWWDRVNYKWD